MPKRFTAHFEAADGSGHFRRVVIFSENEEEAREVLARREQARADFRLTTEELGDLEKREKAAKQDGVTLTGDDRVKLALHRQEEPYKLKWFAEGRSPGPKGKTRRGR